MHPKWEFRTYREPLDLDEWPSIAEVLPLCQNGAQRAGLVRLAVLVEHGGVYVDSDVQPYRAFDPLLKVEAFAGWEDPGVVPDAVLGACPGHPAFVTMLEMALDAVKAGAGAHASGPSISTVVLPGRDDVLVLPPGAFYPFHYLNKAGRYDDHGPWAFCAHLWAESWLSERQRRSNASRQVTSAKPSRRGVR